MKKLKIILKLSAMFTVVMLTTACFFGTAISKTVTPSIRAIGIPDAAAVDSITLTATDANGVIIGETTLSSLTTVPDQISLALPPGNDITFDLTVNMGGTGVITSYTGTATSDITTGITTINISMGIESTKIVVPDARNGRIVQINDISGTGWSTLSSTDLPAWFVTYNPWDVDIDGLGRIVVVNNGISTGEAILWAVDSISSNIFTALYTGDGGLVAVTVDRINSLIYFASSTQLYSCDYTGSNLNSTYTMTGIGSIRGLAVDTEGMIYIAGTTGAGAASVFKYNPAGSGLIVSSYTTNLISPRDVMVKDNYIYIADYDSSTHTNHKIVQLSTNLDAPVELPASGSFPMFGPQRFTAILNKEIFFIDESDDFTDNDKIVAMNDINGTGWNSLGTFGSGINQFAFYYGC